MTEQDADGVYRVQFGEEIQFPFDEPPSPDLSAEIHFADGSSYSYARDEIRVDGDSVLVPVLDWPGKVVTAIEVGCEDSGGRSMISETRNFVREALSRTSD